MKDEYIGISEFAKRAGVSRQAIYERLSSDLSSYCQVIDNQKKLNIKALRLFAVKQTVKETVKVDSSIDTSERLQNELIDILREQLREKDKQIADLSRALDQQQQLSAMQESRIMLLEEKPLEEDTKVERPTLTKEEENIEYDRLCRLLPKSPGLWANYQKVADWEDAQEEAISKMEEWEKELLLKKGFKKGFRYLREN